MLQNCLRKFAFWCFFGLFPCAAIQAHATALHTLPGPVVSAQWLHAHTRDVQIVDVRADPDSLSTPPLFYMQNGEKYLQRVGGHIPGALSVDFLALRDTHRADGLTLDFQFPTSAEFQSLMQSICLRSNEPIVIAPTGDSAISLQEGALLALELTVYGVPPADVSLLDGGTHAWIAAGYPITTDTIFPARSSHWRARSTRPHILAHTADVRRQLAQGRLVLRATTGSIHGHHAQPGRHAARTNQGRNRIACRSDVLTSGGRLLALPHTRTLPGCAGCARYKHGDNTPTDAIVYCNTGQYAAGAWFILNRIIGDPDIRTYEGSLYNWEHRGLPVVGL